MVVISSINRLRLRLRDMKLMVKLAGSNKVIFAENFCDILPAIINKFDLGSYKPSEVAIQCYDADFDAFVDFEEDAQVCDKSILQVILPGMHGCYNSFLLLQNNSVFLLLQKKCPIIRRNRVAP